MNYTIFGESHGPAIGVTVTGVPAGLAIDFNKVEEELSRRKGGGPLTTARKEGDRVEVLSGVYRGFTTGTPLTLIIRNENQRSEDYEAQMRLPRPSHGDYTGVLRYHNFSDPRGGGHFSGRLTAPLVAAGAIGKQLLAQREIFVGAHIASIGAVSDEPLDPALDGREALARAARKPLPVLSDRRGEEMARAIRQVREEGDSLGGTIECMVCGLPGGLGAPDIDENAEGIFARHLFAVPAVRGVEFGEGFALARLRGSQANDPFILADGEIRTRTNRSGGINGGVTNGMPLVFSVVIRPTPSISLEQDTVDLKRRAQAKLSVTGRHDPCIVPRAVPVIEAAAALAACQLLGL